MKRYRFSVWRPFYAEVEVMADTHDAAMAEARRKGKALRSLSFAPGEADETEVQPENLIDEATKGQTK